MGPQKLLIVDDSPDIHELVQAWLVTEPLQFFSCLHGEQAEWSRGPRRGRSGAVMTEPGADTGRLGLMML